MSTSDQLCSDETRLLEFLSGRLEKSDEDALERHLDQCISCQNLLERTAADETSWTEATEMLTNDPWRSFLSGTHVENDAGGLSISLQVKQVLETLQPTDDPQMLGRLGGYEISGVVGSGGMGVVLKAADQSLDRTVAIKVLSPHLASSGAARTRFEREAKAAAAVIHPNVIAIHAVSNDTALPLLVMPYVRGVTLQKRVDSEGPLPTIDVLRIGSQIASGLAAAHRQGLVHRDIKPANVLLEDGVERVAITDFGLARAVDDASVTRTGVIAGTPQYMSPEQACGESVDHRTDLFSLGSVLYTLCTGRPPFRAETTLGILRRITDNAAHPIRESNPEIPEWLCALVEKLHAKPVELRYQSAEEVAGLLEQCVAHLQTPNSPLPDELISRAKPRRLGGWISALSAVAIVAFLLSDFGLFHPNHSDPQPDAQTKVLRKTDSEHSSPTVGITTSPGTASRRTGSTSTELSAVSASTPSYSWDDEFAPSPSEIVHRVRQLSDEIQHPFSTFGSTVAESTDHSNEVLDDE